MGIEEEEMQAKDKHNIFNNVIAEKFPNVKKLKPIHIKKTSRITNREEENRTSSQHIIAKTISRENKE
jgi:hypothetical protein